MVKVVVSGFRRRRHSCSVAAVCHDGQAAVPRAFKAMREGGSSQASLTNAAVGAGERR